jgi:MOSC domain-containing protein YiiM
MASRASGRVVSVNVGLPRPVLWRGETVLTGIFKEPVDGPVRVAGINLDGDSQADRTVHGGANKAVYVYPAEHYTYWEEELGRDLPWGMFGENLTLAGGRLEGSLAIGDRLSIGTAEFVVAQPRLPCFKLGIRFDDPHMIRRFVASRRSGYYLRIAGDGFVAAGDLVETVACDTARVSVSEIWSLVTREQDDTDALRRALTVDALPGDLRSYFEELLYAAAG